MLTIGQLAARTGATQRALRLYERHGLLTADRTPAGRRAYGAEHVTAVAQILTLKAMGLTLATIAGLMKRRTLDAAELIDVRLAQVEAEQERLSNLAASLRAARGSLDAGPIDVATLAALLTDPTAARFQQLIDRWFTPSEQGEWRAAAPDQGGWRARIALVQAAVRDGVTPDSDEGRRLAIDWYEAMRPTMQAVGRERWNRGAALFQDAASGEGVAADFASVHDWISRALAAAQAA